MLPAFVQRILTHRPAPTDQYTIPLETSTAGLAAVCAYFNPLGSRSRRKNLERFVAAHRALATPIPLLIVEAAFGDAPFELPADPWTLRLRARDPLWLKEALLNQGVRELAQRGFETVAWLDADIEFSDPFWPARVRCALEASRLVQLFSHSVRAEEAQHWLCARRGVAAHFVSRNRLSLRGLSSGYAWAARIDSLLRVPLYEMAVLGGGDAAIWLAAHATTRVRWMRELGHTRFFRNLPPAMREHYLDWAMRFGREIRGEVSYLEQTVRAMAHGPIAARMHGRRYRLLPNLDPRHDLRISAQGLPEWVDYARGGEKVKAYFAGRRDDDGAL